MAGLPHTQGARVLDVGGGPGLIAGFLDGFYVNLDPEPGLLRLSPPSPGSERVLGVGESPPFRRSSFTHVLLVDVLHHSETPLSLLFSAASLTRCRLLVEDLDSERRLVFLVRVAERLLGFPARFLAMRDVRDTLESAGFSVRLLREGTLYVVEAARPGC